MPRLSDRTSKEMSSQPGQRLLPQSRPRRRDAVPGGGVPGRVPAFRATMHSAALTRPLCSPHVFNTLGYKLRIALATASGNSLLKSF